MYVVDASVWVSRLHKDDTNHADSHDWLKAAIESNEVLLGPTLLLSEVAGPIARITGDGAAGVDAMGLLMATRNLTFSVVDFVLGLSAGNSAGWLRLKGADAVYLALAEAHDCALVTWDKEFLERSASSSIQVVRPSDLLVAGQ
jgi:predicted nucleic acid-binding protein